MESVATSGKQLQKSYFDLLGLCCTSEVPLVERILKSLDGVQDFSVQVPTKTVIVFHDSVILSQIQIVKALNQSRLEASVRLYGETSHNIKWPSPYAVICGVLLLLSLLRYGYSPLGWLALAAIGVGMVPIFLKAVASVRHLTLDINILAIIAVAGSVALQDYWEAGTIVFLFNIAEWLESYASHKATASMSSLVSMAPQRAVLADTGEEIDAHEVRLSTILAVKAGEVIPIDGIVVEGTCEVDEKFMTGESYPVAKQKDSNVFASTINLNGYITVKTTAVAEDCVVSRMIKLVEDAQNNKSKTQRYIDTCAKYYTPAIVAIAACLAMVPVVFSVHEKRHWFHLSLVILVSGCPCALLLSTPVVMYCALLKATRIGVLFKGAVHMETLGKIKIMAFDKTGTITRGEFQVENFTPMQENISMEKLLYCISSIESKSSHPMADALVDFARVHQIQPKPENVESFQTFPGEGISGRIEGYDVYIGNRKMASRAGCNEVPSLEGYGTAGMSTGYIFLGSSLAAVFRLSDSCRTGAKEALNDLKSLGIRTVMLTGDSKEAAHHAQIQLGGSLTRVEHELLPRDKERIIRELQRDGPTAMIGDGVNDAPALSTADIGISMGVSGSALATETGDVVLMSNDIQRIPKAFRIARNVRRKIIENVAISIATKGAIVGLAIAGHPLVWAAVLADVGTCVTVIFNSMMLRGGGSSHSHAHKHKGNGVSCCSSNTNGSSCLDIESQNKCGSNQSCDSSHNHHNHDHGNGHCNGHGHSHDHDHSQAHEHCHGHDHSHEDGQSHDHRGGNSHDHAHDHSQAHGHCHGHDHRGGNSHDHGHDHSQAHGHCHGHDHRHDDGHLHDHSHNHDHSHDDGH